MGGVDSLFSNLYFNEHRYILYRHKVERSSLLRHVHFPFHIPPLFSPVASSDHFISPALFSPFVSSLPRGFSPSFPPRCVSFPPPRSFARRVSGFSLSFRLWRGGAVGGGRKSTLWVTCEFQFTLQFASGGERKSTLRFRFQIICVREINFGKLLLFFMYESL